MGKSKRRSKASRFHATPLGKNRSTQKDEVMTAKKVQPLLKQLQSAVPNDRAMALGSVTVLCEDPYLRKLFLKEKLVPLVMTKLLSDTNMEIMVEAHGLLRNLALEEGYDVCVFLWRSDIWTSITAGFDKLQKSLQWLSSNNPSKKESSRQLFDFGENLISLVVALADGSDKIVDDILSSDKLQSIFSVVRSVAEYGITYEDGSACLRIPPALFNTILDLLFDFGSESADFMHALAQDSFLSGFVEALPTLQLKTANELSAVLIQGIRLQCLDLSLTSIQANEIIINACSAIEAIDLENMKKFLSTTDLDNELGNAPDDQISKKIKEHTKQRALASMRLQSIEATLDIVTASLEILAAKYEDENETVNENLMQTLTVSLPVVFQSLYNDFQSRVLIAWNNMLWLYLTMQINFLGLSDVTWQQLWLSVSASSDEEESDYGIKLGKLGVMWALLKTLQLQDNKTPYLTSFNCDNAEFVSAIQADFTNSTQLGAEEGIAIRQRCCGILSCLAMLPDHIELNRQIGHFFMEILADKETTAATMVDVCDVLFDVYADASYDYDESVFVKDQFLGIFENTVVPNMKENFKFVDKNKDPAFKARTQNCLRTVERFIDYKVSERR
ncbi:LADA_0E12464g1_1 [Lachancea dasiensis]|uniref:LADA_0E12464g1_1 n=1 Tax=Lachancea dasiensis TaxID=1072105 RepID=A0A1G4JF30_9SACH|nr:LADA_0E12464g1_1 [Lachancea dasiensis]